MSSPAPGSRINLNGLFLVKEITHFNFATAGLNSAPLPWTAPSGPLAPSAFGAQMRSSIGGPGWVCYQGPDGEWWNGNGDEGSAAPCGNNPLAEDSVTWVDDQICLTASQMPKGTPLPTALAGRTVMGAYVNTYPHSFLFGRIEVCLQTCGAAGLDPAVWLLRTDFTGGPELDIVETGFAVPQAAPTSYIGTAHSKDAGWLASQGISLPAGSTGGKSIRGSTPKADDLSRAYHRYGMDWRSDFVTWDLDGIVQGSLPTPPDCLSPMYVIASLGSGTASGWPGPVAASALPQSMRIAYIRIYT